MAAKKKQHKYKPPEKRDVTENDRLQGWEPDRSLLEVRSYRQPSPYEIASLSISLANGADPKNHLEDAFDLYWDSYHLLHEKWASTVKANRKFVSEFMNDPDKDNVLLEPAEGWDEARQYLKDHGYRLETAKYIFKLLKPVWIDLRQPEFFPGHAEHMFSLLRKEPSIRLGTRYLDEIVRRKTAKRSKGAKKSHETQKRNSAKKTGKK